MTGLLQDPLHACGRPNIIPSICCTPILSKVHILMHMQVPPLPTHANTGARHLMRPWLPHYHSLQPVSAGSMAGEGAGADAASICAGHCG